MGQRKKIGLFYSYNETWIGGTYYIQNLVNAFNTLDDGDKPQLIVFSDDVAHYHKLADATGYPHMSHHIFPQPGFIRRSINKVSKALLNKRILKHRLPDMDVLFPTIDDQFLRKDLNKLFWIPDMQERFLPHLFDEKELEQRKIWQQKLVDGRKTILFSSRSAHQDFMDLFPGAQTKVHVIPFAVTHPPYQQLEIGALKDKFGIRGDYFITPNQLWAHKNHRLIVDAVRLLHQRGMSVTVVFTGNTKDYRNPGYFGELKQYIAESGVSDRILILGFIDRAEQLKLMKEAIAVIQPSRFEGWSTVVEDAKAMNQFVIASGIAVHVEQMKDNVVFFDPDNAGELADLMADASRHKPVIKQNDYKDTVRQFAQRFIEAAR